MINRYINIFLIITLLFCACKVPADKQITRPGQYLLVLGVAQDAGYPQIGCEKECCNAFWQGKESKKHVVSLAIMDEKSGKYWLIEATPDIREQMKEMEKFIPGKNYQPAGIFLTHAHIGHYSGLMQLGREAMSAKNIPVYVQPRMDSFLRYNGPWSQLVALNNIELRAQGGSTSLGNDSFFIEPVRAPHRDEYSETVGFRIHGPHKTILFIPDIDKWQKWDKQLSEEIRFVDHAFLDGTFYGEGELPGRNMAEIPHPFVPETMELLKDLPASEKAKVWFIHFNHTNPLLKRVSKEKENVKAAGFNVAEEEMLFDL